MMPTPNVYLENENNLYEHLETPLKSKEVQVFYVTDRTPEQKENGDVYYGSGRSASVAFGITTVDLGIDMSWEDLVKASRSEKRLNPVKLKLSTVHELVRTPPTPLPYTLVGGKVVVDPDMAAQLEEATGEFKRALMHQLELTPRKDVFIYIHGYHNTFDDAAFALAELWHFIGRVGVPIIYSWPAGYPGLFGYTYDRESSEFTAYHLRKFLELIAEFEEVERIHLIAHSRGTDLALAVLRDLTLSARAAGLDPKKHFKIHNFILAAPDLDLQVAEQRIVGDKLDLSVGRFTIYTSPEDKAIGIASQLFASPRGRLGTFGIDGIPETIKTHLQNETPNFAIINFDGAPDSSLDSYGHSYFRNSPDVSSDLVLMLRDDLDPGTTGRPLIPLDFMFWRIPKGYPGGNTIE
ncbi:MAG: alpha/beta hydrolase [Methyloprofundus sp.]|nr:alpha/beta hydrolase [Methyloprofundus sp.]